MSKSSEDAVSPVIGTLLMVAITVILAVVISVFAFGFGGADPKGPTAGIQVSSILDTPAIDLKIQHKGGDTLRAGDWKISITKVGDAPEFKVGSTDFKAGDSIVTMNVTDYSPATTVYNVTDEVINITAGDSPAARFVSGEKYEVKIIVYPFKTLSTDTVVMAR